MGNQCDADDADARRAEVRSLYAALAQHPERDFGWAKGAGSARALGYDPDWFARLPLAIWASAAPVGNPFALGLPGRGECVVDLGCGSGADLCVAALQFGARGRGWGIDCTPEMVSVARRNLLRAGITSTTVLEADLAAVPLPAGIADRVISNGAINLHPDKARVLREAFRLLRPGGRLQIADMIRETEEDCAGSWAGCVAGTVTVEAYRELLAGAGFREVRLHAHTDYRTAPGTRGALFGALRPG